MLYIQILTDYALCLETTYFSVTLIKHFSKNSLKEKERQLKPKAWYLGNVPFLSLKYFDYSEYIIGNQLTNH